MKSINYIFALLVLEVAAASATNMPISLIPQGDYAIWENTIHQNGYKFTQDEKWQFYLIDEAQNRYISDWNGKPSEGIYQLSNDTIWLFQMIDNQWEKVRGLLVLRATDIELTMKLIDKFDDWRTSFFDESLEYIKGDIVHILNAEQWDKTWDPIYQQRPVSREFSFSVYLLQDKKAERMLKRFVRSEERRTSSDTIGLCVELYVEKKGKGLFLVVNSLPLFSGKDIFGVLDGLCIPAFIHKGDANNKIFAVQQGSMKYSICMEETKYQNGITRYDICDCYLSNPPINTIRIPLRK